MTRSEMQTGTSFPSWTTASGQQSQWISRPRSSTMAGSIPWMLAGTSTRLPNLDLEPEPALPSSFSMNFLIMLCGDAPGR